jgi:hypothetical protein
MRRLPHQGAKHGAVDHGDTSNGIFSLLRRCRGRALTSTSTCGASLNSIDPCHERSLSSPTSLASRQPLGQMALLLQMVAPTRA